MVQTSSRGDGSTAFFLLVHAITLGLTGIGLVAIVTRKLPSEQISSFFQIYATTNTVTLAFLGSLEALVPRLWSRSTKLSSSLKLAAFALMAAITLNLVIIQMLGQSHNLEVVAGTTGAVILYAGYAVARGFLISQGDWSGLALSATLQMVFTLGGLALPFLPAGGIAFIYLALMAGYFPSMFMALCLWFRKEVLASRLPHKSSDIQNEISIVSFLGFATSSFLVTSISSLPIFFSEKLGLSTMDVILLSTGPYLVRVAINLANSATPYFLHAHQKLHESSAYLLRKQLLIFAVPGSVAALFTVLFGSEILSTYTGQTVVLPAGLAACLALSELLFGIATVPRTHAVSKTGAGLQLFSWSSGYLFLFFSLALEIPNSLLQITLHLLFASVFVLGLQLPGTGLRSFERILKARS